MEGKILDYDLKGFRQCLSSEGRKHFQTTKMLYHILDKLREVGRRDTCEHCMQTWLAEGSMLALTLFRKITFAKQLPLTILHAITLLGTSAAHCTAQIQRVPGIIPPRPECTKSPCKPALPSLPLAEFLQSESLGSVQCL